MAYEIDLGGWGADLDDDAFGRSLAALGVTVAAQEGGSLDEVVRAAADPAALGRLLGNGGSVRWRIDRVLEAPTEARAALADGVAGAAAAAWEQAIQLRGAGPVPRLRLDPPPGTVDQCAWLADQLGQPGVGAASFVAVASSPGSPGWRRPLRVGVLRDPMSAALRDPIAAGADPGRSIRVLDAEREPVDLLVLPHSMPAALDQLRRVGRRLTAGCVLMLGGLGGDVGVSVGDLLGKVQARVTPWSILVATVAEDDAARWMSALLGALDHKVTLDVALNSAFAGGGRGVLFADPDALDEAAGRRPETRPVEQDRGALADPAGDLPQSDDGSDAGAIAAAAERLRRRRARTPHARPRWLQVEIRDEGRTDGRARRAALRAGMPYTVDVWIGPRTRRAISGNRAFPDQELFREDTLVERLQVVFAELGGTGRTLTGEVVLPRDGASTRQPFRVEIDRPDTYRARVMVLHGNRILQTAVLSAAVTLTGSRGTAEPIRLRIEAVVRAALTDLAGRPAFSAALVHNTDGNGDPGGTAMSGGTAIPLQLGDVQATVDTIVGRLSQIADDPAAYGPTLDATATVELLYLLAGHGALLRDGLFEERPLLAAMLRDAPRIQVLAADPNHILPLEFVYDFPTPSEPTLCSNAQQALVDGHCDPENHPLAADGSTPFVCPVGFWAMNRVIERHVADPVRFETDLRGVQFELSAEPVGDRDELRGLASALFAASAQVDVSVEGGIASVESALETATAGKATRVKTWDAWVTAVAADEPSLLVLLTHTVRDDVAGQTALEIETAERRTLGRFGAPYVRTTKAPPPIVLLLGCDTAVVDMEYETFVSRFRSAGAALVVGTIATVAGRHAARVASALSTALAHPGAARPAMAFGDLLLAARRELIGQGGVMALCLTAYGDAEWRFPAGNA